MAESTAELIRTASGQVSTLVRDELRLARAELTQKARDAGLGAGLVAGAAIAVFYGVGAILVAAGLGLAEAMPGWLAALIVFAFLIVVAAVLGLIARAHFRRATPATPQRTIESVHADIDAVETAVRERGAR